MKRAALIGICHLLALGCAPTTPQPSNFADGLAAYNRGDYTTALAILKPLASEDQPDAAYIVGEMYAYAQGVPQDYSAAVWVSQEATDVLRNGFNAFSRTRKVLGKTKVGPEYTSRLLSLTTM